MIGANFAKIRPHVYLGQKLTDWVFGSKGQRSRSQQAEATTARRVPSSYDCYRHVKETLRFTVHEVTEL